MIIEETKLDASLPNGQFTVPCSKQPYHRDRDVHGGGVIMYIREDIPSKKLDSSKLDGGMRSIFRIKPQKIKMVNVCSI